MIRKVFQVVFLLAVIWMLPVCLRADENDKPDDDRPKEEQVVKVYRVLGLLTQAPDYSYEGTYLPSAYDGRVVKPLGGLGGGYGGMGGGMMGGMGGGMGGMGGGMGGMGGGMGGGMFRVADNLAQAAGGQATATAAAGVAGPARPNGPAMGSTAAHRRPDPRRINMDDLINAITSTVEPESWDEVGGPGSISAIGGALAIRQTQAIQSQVKSFLEELQREIGTLRVLTIDAQWLLLSKTQLAQLQTSADPKKSPIAGRTIRREALEALPAETRRYAGQITCLNGQTVHIISGRLESVLQGGIPIVGGPDAVGYQPVLLTPHFGVLLQVTPSALPGDEGVMIDVQSTVTRRNPSEKTVRLTTVGSDEEHETVVQIDRLNVTAQQFATSMRMSLGKPVLVGGLTFPGAEPASPDDQLYLVIEVQPSPEP